MVKVVRTDRQGERVMMLTEKVWDKLVAKPNLVAGVKWKLWVAPRKATTRFVEVPIDAEVEIITKKVEPKNVEPDYGEKDYKSDMALAKKLLIEDGGVGAKEAFDRALAFKPKNPYIKKKLKELS